MHIDSEWLINTYILKTAVKVGVEGKFKSENVFGYWEQNYVFVFRLNHIHNLLLFTFPFSALSSGRWD